MTPDEKALCHRIANLVRTGLEKHKPAYTGLYLTMAAFAVARSIVTAAIANGTTTALWTRLEKLESPSYEI